MTSNGKQFTITREMLTAVAHDQRWPDVNVAEISARFSKFFCFVLLYNKLMTGPLGNSKFCFLRISGNIEILGKQNSLFPSGPVLSVIIVCIACCHRSCKYLPGSLESSGSSHVVHLFLHLHVD